MGSLNTIFEDWPKLDCGGCTSRKSCKRFTKDRNIEPYRPWFKSSGESTPCREYQPNPALVPWLTQRWTTFDDCVILPKDNETTALFLNGDTDVGYKINLIDYINDTFINEDGSVKWVEKFYYKRSHSSPTGYTLIREKNIE